MGLRRALQLVNDELESIDAALAWLVQTLDTEYAGADMLRVELGQHMVSDDNGQSWRSQWAVSIHGDLLVESDGTGEDATKGVV